MVALIDDEQATLKTFRREGQISGSTLPPDVRAATYRPEQCKSRAAWRA